MTVMTGEGKEDVSSSVGRSGGRCESTWLPGTRSLDLRNNETEAVY
jgi:hypothetical protein